MKKIIGNIKNDEIINQIKSHATENFGEIYLVGGIIRDFYFGNENFDKDIIIEKNAEKFAKMLAEEMNATFIELDEENKIYRIVLKTNFNDVGLKAQPTAQNFIDIAELTGKNIEQDLKRRDLTINSIAVNLKTLEIIDVNNGIEDLKSKKIKGICEQNFIDDPLRLLRIFRFEAMLGFEVDKNLTQLVKKHVGKINQCAVERINYELLKLFSGNYCAKTLINMDNSGLLKELLPISQDLKTVPPNLHHHLNLFDHSIESVNQIQKIYENSSSQVQQHLEKTDFGGFTRLSHLKFASFLHDIGKPSTWTIEEETGKHRFIKHDDIGSKMAITILKKMKFSKKQIEYISKMIKYHIYPSHVVAAPEISDKIYMRFIRKMEEEVIDVIILAMADRFSARGVEITEEIVKKNISNLQALLDFYLNVKETIKPLPKLISGEEIMEILNITPSKKLGEIINQLKEAQLSGDIVTKKQAVTFIKGLSI